MKLVSEIPLHIAVHQGTKVALKQIMEKGSKKLHFLTRVRVVLKDLFSFPVAAVTSVVVCISLIFVLAEPLQVFQV